MPEYVNRKADDLDQLSILLVPFSAMKFHKLTTSLIPRDNNRNGQKNINS